MRLRGVQAARSNSNRTRPVRVVVLVHRHAAEIDRSETRVEARSLARPARALSLAEMKPDRAKISYSRESDCRSAKRDSLLGQPRAFRWTLRNSPQRIRAWLD